MAFRSQTFLPVYRSAEIRNIETNEQVGPALPNLMERAGLAAAEIARNCVADGGRGVLVVAGPGNNGGDAFVVARHLKAWWFNVTVVFAGDAGKLPPDAKKAHSAWLEHGGSVLSSIPAGQHWDLVVDGLFGIGLHRELDSPYSGLVEAINALGTQVLALDVPSGLDADTGRVRGVAVRAHHTATFIGLKPGLLTLDGPDHCGEIHVCGLDLVETALSSQGGHVIGSEIIDSALPVRRANTHKGDYGNVGVIGGAHGMVGAALLAARAALNLGTGRVYVGLLAQDGPSYDALQPELMVRAVHEVLKLKHLNCLAVGPGLGQMPDAHQVLAVALETPAALVLDADALNLISSDRELMGLLGRRAADTVLTPHPAEAARLLGVDTPSVQNDRVHAACSIAQRTRCGVVLKGAGSICVLPHGTWFINTTGNPGMASAGMGDVLTGIIAALLAQGAPLKTALLAGVHLHGAAADQLVDSGVGPVGMTAGEIIVAARKLLNQALELRAR